MATVFGSEVGSGTAVNMSTARALACGSWAMTESGEISSIDVYLSGNGGGTGTALFKGCIWDDDNGGDPGTLKVTSAEGSMTDGAAGQWVSMAVSPPVALTTGTWWIGLITGGVDAVCKRYYNAAVGNQAIYKGNTYASGPPDPYGGADGADADLVFSIHAHYGQPETPFTGLTVYKTLG